jgi:predicted component of type VI protein secretion system
MKLSLVVMVPGSSNGKLIPITRSPFVIGRDSQCQLRPSSALISSRHCAIEIRGGRAYVSDLKSTNGTSLNQQRLAKEVELKNGDRLQIGPLLFGIKIEDYIPVDQPTPLPPSRTPAPVSDDESIAAVLLGLGEDAPKGDQTLDSTGVPTGGTEVLKTQDIALPPEEAAKAAGEGSKDDKKDKADKVKAAQQNTAVVAEEMLKKYLRRPRNK